MKALSDLRRAVDLGALRPLDLHLARWLAETAGEPTPGRLLAAALASHRVGLGDVCLDLPALAGRAPFPGLPEALAPELADWRGELAGWAAVLGPVAAGTSVDRADRAPLVLDASDRLYLGRYWHYERQVAEAIGARAALWSGDLDRERLADGLARLFPAAGGAPGRGSAPDTQGVSPSPPAGGPDWQRVAAAMALLKPLCAISGGPGTGKTRTVTAILALAVLQARDRAPTPRIGLAAPTGKAAARLAESIRAAKEGFVAAGALDPTLAALIPEVSLTLHRLLGIRPGRVAPRHGPDNPLHLDLLVVDEASMLDLPLAARLLAALPPRCRLILLGDRDQLASVQAGAVLGDICGRGRAPAYSRDLVGALADLSPEDRGVLPQAAGETSSRGTGIADCIVLLRRSYRFGADSGIARVAAAVNRGDGPAALAALDSGLSDVERLDPAADPKGLADFLARFVVSRHRKVLEAQDPAAALRALGRYRILCAVREGPLGVVSLNRLAERALAAAGLLRPENVAYAGRPLLVTANDYELGLYNGDVGLLMPDPESGGALRAFFETAEGVRGFSPHRLPPVETLFAMTVHKSQGSELDELVLALPSQDSRVVTRELIYTGITRARRRVTLIASAERLIEGVARRVERSSGLHDALWA